MKNKNNMAKVLITISMLIFGTLGVFINLIALPSGIIAFARSSIGALFLFLFMKITGRKLSIETIKKNILKLFVSGTLIGINWIFLFEAYRRTSVPKAEITYSMCPIFVVLASPLVFREKLSPKKILCIITAFIGMIFISGVLINHSNQTNNANDIYGILLALAAAIFYAIAVMLNKSGYNMPTVESTAIQLAFIPLSIFPYIFMTQNLSAITLSNLQIMLLIILGIAHTGIAFSCYFASIESLSTQSIAVLTYIDPIASILLSVAVLRQTMNIYEIFGTFLILSATYISERTNE